MATETVVAAPLLEREEETAAIAAAADAARSGRGRLVVVEADAGIGKSRLLDHAARTTGLRVLRTAGAPLEREHPFGAVTRLFGGAVRAGAGSEGGVLAGAAGLAAGLFAPGRDGPDPAGDFSVHHGLHWLVANLSDEGPLLLVVDDAHWLDDLSLRFFSYLALRLDDLPVLLLVAHRPEEPGAALDLLAEIQATPDAVVLRPAALGPAGAAAFVHAGDPDASETFTAAAHSATGGNPLLLRELLAALAAEGVGTGGDGARRALEIGPRSVWRLVELQLRRLGDEPTAVARAAAILGDDADPATIAALAGIDARAARTAIAALERARVLAAGTGVRYVHPIMRAAVAEELTPAERANAHGRAAGLLRDAGDVERVAGHLLRGAPQGAPWAVDVLAEAAARAAASGSPATAVLHLRRALAETDDAERQAALLLELGRLEALAGDPVSATTLLRAVEAAPGPRDRARALAELGRAHMARGEFGQSVAAFTEATEVLEAAPGLAPDDGLLLELRAGLIAAGLWHRDSGVGTDIDARFAALLDDPDVPRVPGERALLATAGGSEMLRGGDRDRALDLARRAWGDGRFLEELGHDEPSFSAITGVFLQADAWDEALAVVEAAITQARRLGDPTAFATFSYIRGVGRVFTGRLADAIADLEACREAERSGWEQYLAPARWQLVLAALARGDVDRARSATVLDEDVEARARQTPMFCALLVARGRVALHDGRPEEALALFEESGRIQEAIVGVRNPSLIGWRGDAALALHRLGDVDRAVSLAREDLAIVEVWGAPRPLARSLRRLGLVVPGEAERLDALGRAVEVVAGTGALLEEMQSRLALGVAQRRAGKRTLAQESLRDALDRADRCGAVPSAERAREELRMLGVRPRRARTSGPDSLTPGERRVARLAAEGLTNREIAQALFVTRKAVEYHLGNVYRKLETRSRRELPALLDPGPSGD